jgi:DNA-directed RNA polymerase specialized sigma24 family protein
VTGRARDQGPGELAQAFEAQCLRLVRLVYATTGMLAEAADCVQAAWLSCPPARAKSGPPASSRL